tara:strand:+ start:15 stop:404 length:390 start_codon:yes stop_codon:yes gene_type:complete
VSNNDAIKQLIDLEYEKSKENIKIDFIYLKEQYDITDKYQFNKLFSILFDNYRSFTFKVIIVISEEMSIKEEKVFKMVDNEMKEKIKNYAVNNYNTLYYQKKEIDKTNNKLRKKGKFNNIRKNIEDLFE